MQNNFNQRFKADGFSQGPNYSAGCGGVGRITNSRSNGSGLKSQGNAHRASSASSLYRRSRNYSQSNEGLSCLPGGWNGTAVYSRPGSAKLWVERCTQKREHEERKKQQLEVANKQFQAAQFRANFFNTRPSAPRCYTVENAAITTKDEQDSVAECSKPDIVQENFEPKSLYNRDAKSQNTDGIFDHKSYRTILGPAELVKPEIATLKKRLEDLHQKNAEERQKLNEELCHQAWQKNSVEARKLESDRLNEFVRSAWVDQRQWREDERKRRELEDLRIEQEAEELRREQEEREHREAEERQRKREQYQRDLEDQLEMMRRQEQQRLELARAADCLAAERDRILEVADRRQQLLQTRRARAIAVSWSRQYHIKLRQRAAQVQQEILEDQQIIKEVQKQQQQHSSLMGSASEAGAAASVSLKNSHTRTKTQDDLSLVLNILEEHRKLEELRQHEYDLLFSEEAARLWRCREEQWEREERAREKLLNEVLEGRLQQVQERSEARAAAEREVEAALEAVKKRVVEVDANISRLESGVIDNGSNGANGDIKGSDVTDLQEEKSEEQIRKSSKEEEERHRKEIARLETEMARLWGPLYTPPHYGRKKVQW